VSRSVALTGTIAAGDVFVAAHERADQAILAVADLISNAVINFNGDDAVVLRKNGAVIDAFGQIGFDPGGGMARRRCRRHVAPQERRLFRRHERQRRLRRLDRVGRVRRQHLRRARRPRRQLWIAAAPPPPPPLTCEAPLDVTLISEVQGDGPTSPLVGQTVVVDAVVTAIFPGLQGFYLQEEPEDSDDDPATSEGIFVFRGTLPDGVGVNDVVRVEGTVGEFVTSGGASSLTQLTRSTVVDCDLPPVTITPTEIELPRTEPGDLEPFEGMLVTLPQSLVISEYFNFDRFGEVVLTSERQLTPTAEFEPGPAAVQAALENSLDRITVDDGRSSQNPDPAIHPGNGDVFDLDNLFRGGDLVTGITGVIDHTFGLYRLQPTAYGTFTEANPRPAAPDRVGGNVQVASFNVLNYFTTIDDSGPICGPAANQGCRGADTPEELVRQRDKIVSAITEIDADVVGLIEIENHVDDAAVTDLVASLNAVPGAGPYAAIETGPIGGDAIKVALIHQPASVTPVGDFAILDSSVDPRFIDTLNRPVLAQTYRDNARRWRVHRRRQPPQVEGLVVRLHRRPEHRRRVGQLQRNPHGRRRGPRRLARHRPDRQRDPDMLIIGDLNAYDKETPIDAIVAGADDVTGTGDDYTDLVARFLGEDAYSFVFDGQVGYLDHALANAACSTRSPVRPCGSSTPTNPT
jgi:uncharacterized protein